MSNKSMNDFIRGRAGHVVEVTPTAGGDISHRVDIESAFKSAGIKNQKLAYLAAQDSDLIGDDGTVNMHQLKQLHPELFHVPEAHAGHGQSDRILARKSVTSMNDFIRMSAGKRI